MADEILRSRHAFGQLENVDLAISEGKVDAYDILFLKDKNGKPVLGWIDKDGNKVILEDSEGKSQVLLVEELPETGDAEVIYIYNSTFYFWNGSEFIAQTSETGVSEDVVNAKIEAALSEANAYTNEMLETALDDYLVKKYVISHKPEGTLVNYRDKEIRVMCPADTEFVLQNSGEGADKNCYYIGFKAYAPSDDVVNFKEDLAETISDETLYSFENNEFAGIEEDGRKYSIVWLPVAKYDETTETWTYYGAESSEEKYIGWYYSVEWYNSNGKVVASDCIRINLSNEDCHAAIAPSYVSSMIDAKIAEVASWYEIVEF